MTKRTIADEASNHVDYGASFLITCDGSPYQLRDGDIIRETSTGDLFMVDNIMIPGDEPIVVLTPYEPIYKRVGNNGELAGFEHVFIHQSGSYPIGSISKGSTDIGA